ncbi:MAG: hypothetical protein KKB50_03980, partial [Planctomycetes bacterium]|nr:hypothetical protein [Planctomycetota bacterium]
ARWFYNDDQDADRMEVEISNDNGANWEPVESVAHTSGWVYVTLNVTDYITPTAQVRMRFSVADSPNDSVTEAGLDAFMVSSFDCIEGLRGDLNCDDRIDGFDINAFILVLSDSPPYDDYYTAYPDCDHMLADLNGDGRVDGMDIDPFVELLAGMP